jgi:hypothetical protein
MSTSAIRCTGWRTSDGTFALAERTSLAPTADFGQKCDFVQMLLKSGRYERAFTEALQMKNSLRRTEIDAVFANAAVRLLQGWGDFGGLCFGDLGKDQSAIDIAFARFLSHARKQNSAEITPDLAVV